MKILSQKLLEAQAHEREAKRLRVLIRLTQWIVKNFCQKDIIVWMAISDIKTPDDVARFIGRLQNEGLTSEEESAILNILAELPGAQS